MLTKNQVKFITSLADKRSRKEEGLFIAEGVKIVNELLSSSIEVRQVFAVKEWIQRREDEGQGTGYRGQGTGGRGEKDMKKLQKPEVLEVSEAELKKISQLTTPNQVLAVAAIPGWELDTAALKKQACAGAG